MEDNEEEEGRISQLSAYFKCHQTPMRTRERERSAIAESDFQTPPALTWWEHARASLVGENVWGWGYPGSWCDHSVSLRGRFGFFTVFNPERIPNGLESLYSTSMNYIFEFKFLSKLTGKSSLNIVSDVLRSSRLKCPWLGAIRQR